LRLLDGILNELIDKALVTQNKVRSPCPCPACSPVSC